MRKLPALFLALCATSLHAQKAADPAPKASSYKFIDPAMKGERIIAIVPMIGAGTYADPKRPLFAPSDAQLRDGRGISHFTYELSDDGKNAIVQIGVRDRQALAPLLTDSRALKIFDRDKDKLKDLESELKKYKADFKLTPEASGR